MFTIPSSKSLLFEDQDSIPTSTGKPLRFAFVNSLFTLCLQIKQRVELKYEKNPLELLCSYCTVCGIEQCLLFRTTLKLLLLFKL